MKIRRKRQEEEKEEQEEEEEEKLQNPHPLRLPAAQEKTSPRSGYSVSGLQKEAP